MARAADQTAQQDTTIPIYAPDGHELPVRVDVTFNFDGELFIDVSLNPSANVSFATDDLKLTPHHFVVTLKGASRDE